jgi:hypothetical protein
MPAVFKFTYSGEGRQSHFWRVSLRHNYSLCLFPGTDVIGTASRLHCNERDDYTDKHYVY